MQTVNPEEKNSRQRSWFWPVVLIALGLIWLLRNLDMLGSANIAMMFRLWPLLLIAVGLDLAFRRTSPRLGTLLGIGTVALAVVLMIVGPALGWGKLDVKQASYSEPKTGVDSALVRLEVGVGGATITPLEGDNLFQADIGYVGELSYSATGTAVKTIVLRQVEGSVSFGLGNWPGTDSNLRWNVRLNKDIPFSLDINAGVGESSLDLSNLQLTSLNLNTGVGRVDVKLPAMKSAFKVTLNGGVGTTEITMIQESSVDLLIDGGVGTTILNIPAEAAVRVEKSGGLSGTNLPANFVRISGNESDPGSNRGVWETPNFSSATQKITVTFNGGIGGLTIRSAASF